MVNMDVLSFLASYARAREASAMSLDANAFLWAALEILRFSVALS